MMFKKPAGVLMFLLVILKVLGTAVAACDCSSSECDCSYSFLSRVPQYLPTTITYLELHANQITTLSQSDFSRYRSLETLVITWNHISTINNQAFSFLSNLVNLSLYNNRLTILGSDMFTGLGNVQRISIYRNDITDIQAGTFSSTPQLRRLHLSNNKLTHLRSDMFTGLGNLEELYLSSNEINNIQAGTFNPMRRLRYLFLGGNKLTNLRFDMFTGLGNLEELRLDNNDMTDIQTGTFNLIPQLGTLRLNNNKLTSLMIRSDMFTGLGNLENLWLHNNKITDIQTGTFTGLGNLQELTLHHNDMTDIQAGTFNSTPQLRVLQLSNNQIQSIPRNLLANLLQLRELELSDNNITTFPFEDLSRNQTLNRLYLHNNEMATLPSSAHDVLSSISENSPWLFDVDFDSLWPYYVNINNNPWQCDCRMVDFRLQMTATYPFEHQVTCSQPDHLNGLKLIDIDPEDLDMSNCPDPTIMRFERVGDNTLVLGDTLQLICEPSGIPTPDITVILPSGQNTTVGSHGRVTVEVTGRIIMRNVTAADTGLYVCIATNFVGFTFSTLSVHVDLISEEPTIMRFEMVNSDPLVQGEMLILVCQASGIPTPDITVILPSGLNATVGSVGRVTVDVNGTVIITDVTAAGDAGLYVCIAENSVGSKFAVLDVDITPVPMASFSLPVLLGATCGSIAGTFLIVSIILAFWCKRNNRKPPIKGPDFSVVFNNTNTTTTVITNGRDLTGQTQTQPISESSDIRNPPLAPLPASSQLEPQYEDVLLPPRGAVPRQTTRSADVRNPNVIRRPDSSHFKPPSRSAVTRQTAGGQAPQPPNRNNNGSPPQLPPRTTSTTGYRSGRDVYETTPGESSHHYQPLKKTTNSSANTCEPQHHYQSLQRPKNMIKD